MKGGENSTRPLIFRESEFDSSSGKAAEDEPQKTLRTARAGAGTVLVLVLLYRKWQIISSTFYPLKTFSVWVQASKTHLSDFMLTNVPADV